MRWLILFLITFLKPLLVYTQVDSFLIKVQLDNYAGIPDSIMKEINAVKAFAVPNHETANSSFRYYELADSFSRIPDTINAEKNFLLVDPYHLLSMRVAYSNDDFITRFALRDSVRLFIKQILSGLARTAYFDSFANSYLKVQNYRKLIGDNIDLSYQDSLRKIDSVQQEYLWNYVMKYGTWPPLSEGAVFAAIIAARDIEHYYKYVPFAVAAYNDNKISSGHAMQILDNKHCYSFYMDVMGNIKNKYIRNDLSWCLSSKNRYISLAELMDKIGSDIKNKCPIKNIFFVHYVNNIKSFSKNDYCNEEAIREDAHDLLLFVKENCSKFYTRPRVIECATYHLPNLMYDTEKLFFYITY